MRIAGRQTKVGVGQGGHPDGNPILTRMERACIVYNPAARNAPGRQRLERAIEAVGREWEIRLAATETSGHATDLARDAAKGGASVVVACGGDGTVNEVVNGLAGGETALAVLRGGMGDVFAKEAGISKSAERALPQLLGGERKRFDLGIAGERYFLLMAGVGFDAEVVRSVPDEAKKRWGSTSYAVWALRRLPAYKPKLVFMLLDDVAVNMDLYWLLAGNTRSYGGFLDITSEARVDDGCLDAYAFAGRGPLWLTRTAVRTGLRRLDGASGVTFRRLRRVQIETAGLAVQVDGEYIGETPIELSVAPASLDVLLPRGKGRKLFGAQPAPPCGTDVPTG
jgi:diacylglycerol kinase (ATP)